jgi:hypothetical protein
MACQLVHMGPLIKNVLPHRIRFINPHMSLNSRAAGCGLRLFNSEVGALGCAG